MTTTPQPTPHSFTIRVPRELYLQVCESAAIEGVAINVKVNQLIHLGLGHQVDLNRILARMISRFATEETPT